MIYKMFLKTYFFNLCADCLTVIKQIQSKCIDIKIGIFCMKCAIKNIQSIKTYIKS